jgi:hypothetical protein
MQIGKHNKRNVCKIVFIDYELSGVISFGKTHVLKGDINLRHKRRIQKLIFKKR